jgi:negative modulator of initiation of replication
MEAVMKTIEIDEELYAYIASQTKHIGESASQILRRLLLGDADAAVPTPVVEKDDSPIDSQPPVQKRQTHAAKPPVNPNITLGHGSLEERVTPDSLAKFDKRVDQFLFILAQVYDLHGDEFAKVKEIKGKNRVYFATSKEELIDAGSSTNPKAIPQSNYWVVTNNNTAKKVTMLEQVLTLLGHTKAQIATISGLFAPELKKP